MEKKVIIDNLLIQYVQSGNPAGDALIFLHGWRSQKEIWNAIMASSQLSALTEQVSKFNCIAIDFPGFGKSQLPSKPFGIAEYAKIVELFIEKLELKNVTLIGHSFGGRVAIKLAASCPKHIGRLVLVDSAGFAMGASKKKLLGLSAKFIKPFFKPQFMQPLRKSIYKAIGAEDYVTTPELQKTFVKIVTEDLTADMTHIICPALLVFGQADVDTPVSFGERMQKLIPQAKLIILNDAGHFSFIDQPIQFLEALITFIQA